MNRHVLMLALAVLSLATLILWSYGDSLGAFFLTDDYWVMRAADAIHVNSPADLLAFFRPEPFYLLYRPLSTLMYFWLLAAAFGHDPAGYHAVQLAFHVANAVLVYAIAARLLQRPLAGLVAALIYATAPGHAIATFWIALFTMTGTAFFYFLAMYAWIAGGRHRVGLTYLLFGVALLSSEHAISLPITLTLLSAMVPERADWRRIAREQAGFYAIAACYAASKLYYLYIVMPHSLDPIAYSWIRSAYGLKIDPVSALQNLGKYLANSTAITNAPVTGARTTLVLGAAYAVASSAALAFALLRRPASPALRVAAFAVVFFVVAPGPVLFLGSHASSYYVGIAAFGVALAIAAVASALPRASGNALLATAALFVAVHVGWTAARVRTGLDFRIFDEYSQRSAAWFYTLSVRARDSAVTEVVIPEGALEQVAIDNDAHRVLLCARYSLRASKNVAAEAPARGRLVLTEALPLPAGRGPSRDWHWLGEACDDRPR